MNTKEYIESGILEAYVLGALSAQEAQEVAANIALYPELAKEVREIESSMQLYASSLAKDPPAGMEDKIWSAIQSERANAGDGETPKQTSTPKVIPFQPEYRKPAQWKLAAVWAGLILSVGANAMLWMGSEHKKTEIASLSGRVSAMEQDQKQLADLLSNYQKNKTMMADTGMQTIVMHTVLPDHPMAATLYWSKNKGEAYVSVDGLPIPPRGMQYQLWVMENGKPVDMGVISNNIANTPAMQKVAMPVTDGQAFAISLEKEGGSPTPTMQNIYVMGKV